MSAAPSLAEQAPALTFDAPLSAAPSSSPIWDRISTWASEHKAVVYTIAGATLVVTAAGVLYYVSESQSATAPKSKKKSKSRRRGKKDEAKARDASVEPDRSATVTSADTSLEFDELTDDVIETLSLEERKEYAYKIKTVGNKLYVAKDYQKAIELYTRCLDLHQEHIFYANRAACWQVLGEWDKVVEDTTAALSLDPMYSKALGRRANAYEQLHRYSEALVDYTACCIMDHFTNTSNATKVETLLQTVAAAKGHELYSKKERKLPSVAFVGNYLQSFRQKPLPSGLENTTDFDETSGKAELRKAILAMASRGAAEYNEAFHCSEKALELGGLGEHEALALNMRGTFRWLIGDVGSAMEDINESIKLDPTMIQSYVKRATMRMESSMYYQEEVEFTGEFPDDSDNRDAAFEDFEEAIKRSPDDPDIYYHRGQLQFVLGEFQAAAQDYQKSIDLDNDFVFSHIQLGVMQYKLGSVASGLATLKRCIKNFEHLPDPYIYFGELLLDQQQFDKAIEQFDKAIELETQVHPTGVNVLPLVNKALAKFQGFQATQEAEELCQKALLRKYFQDFWAC
jgi:import receptor subunit TOM70